MPLLPVVVVATEAPLSESVVVVLGVGLTVPEIANVCPPEGWPGVVGEVTLLLGFTVPVQPMPHRAIAEMASHNVALPMGPFRVSICLDGRMALRTVLGSGYQEAADQRFEQRTN